MINFEEDNIFSFSGLSTDLKPNKCGTGSTFYEIDTGEGWYFDKMNINSATGNGWWKV